MTAFATRKLAAGCDDIAPDGSHVRILLQLDGGSMAHFTLAPGRISSAVAHRKVEEIWFILSGQGEMWRKQNRREEITRLEPGLCLTIPVGTHFQFRTLAEEALTAVAITMPPWPGADEAYPVAGTWTASA